MGSSIHFAGHIISDGNIRPDDEKFRAHVAKTYRTATQLYYWPNMKQDIKISVSACRPRTKEQQPEAYDLFSAVGKQWLALVDRYSGFGWAAYVAIGELVQQFWLAFTFKFRWQATVRIRVQQFLPLARHLARAIFPL